MKKFGFWGRRQDQRIHGILIGLQIYIILQGSLCQFDLSNTCGSHLHCQNNGTCLYSTNNTIPGTSSDDSVGNCVCLPGFAGYHCEIEANNCSLPDNACENGGDCIFDNQTLIEHCKCVPGYTGKFCSDNIDDCASLPCHHGGSCIDKINGFDCACPFGYTGRLCESKLKICEDNPCKNDGFCLEEEDNMKKCYCVPDYHGTYCEFRYNECEPEPQCNNGGTCIDGVGEFKCSCPETFYGPTCNCSTVNITSQYCQELLNNNTLNSSTEWLPPFPTPSTQIFLFSSDEWIASTTMIEVPVLTSIFISDSISISITDQFLTDDIISITSTPLLEYSTMSFMVSDSSDFVTDSEIQETPVVNISTTVLDASPSETLLAINSTQMSTFPGPEITTSIIDELEPTISSLEPTIILTTELLQQSSIESEQVPFTTPFLNESETAMFPLTSTFELPESTTIIIDISQTTTIIGSSIEILTIVMTSSLPEEVEPSVTDFTLSIVTESVQIITATQEVEESQSQLLSSSFFSSPLETSYISPSSTPLESTIDSSVFETFSTELIEATSITTEMASQLSTDGLETFVIEPTATESGSEAIIETSSDIFTQSTQIIIAPSPTISEPIVVISSTEVIFQPTTTTEESPITIEPIDNTTTTTLPLSTTTTEPSIIPCETYCLNNAKCTYNNINSSIEPIICHCPFKYSGIHCEILNPKISIPSFQGNSFLTYNLTSDQPNKMIDTSITLATLVRNGLILYTGVLEGLTYILIFIQNGHIVLHFSCGEQSMSFIETRTRIDNGYNFTLDLTMEMLLSENNEIHCSSRLTVNESYTMSGQQIVGKQSFVFKPSFEQMFLGGIDSDLKIRQKLLQDEVIGNSEGFRGCLYQLIINKVEQDMYDLAIDGQNIGECYNFACIINPCYGLAKCIPSHQFPQWECICPEQFEGIRCQIPICSHNPCQNDGSCSVIITNTTSQNITTNSELTTTGDDNTIIQCNCKLGFTGKNCETILNVTQPYFHPVPNYSSFISYIPLPRFRDWFQLKFHFVPKNMTQFGLLLFIGGRNPYYYHYGHTQPTTERDEQQPQIENPTTISLRNDSSSSMSMAMNEIDGDEEEETEDSLDFFAISFLEGYLAVSWNLGSGVSRIVTPYRIDTRLSIHTLYTGRSGRTSWLKVDGMMNISGSSPGKFKRLDTKVNELFVGGYETFRMEGLPYDLSLHEGFAGCVFDLGFRVKNKLFLPQISRGRNVGNCFVDYYGT